MRALSYRSHAVVLCVFILLGGCRSGSDPETIRKDIGDQGKFLVDGFNRQNIAELMSVYWNGPELVAMFPDTTYAGSDDVKQLWWDLFAKGEVKHFGITESHVEPAESGDLAYEWGKFDFSYLPRNGSLVEMSGRFLRVWKKQNKRWVIAVTESSGLLMPATPASAKRNAEKNNI
ncbi:MAG TPA: nuclear transport factor 2 family protein [Bacteroidota bacterium]|nr:nuclear transport factor 2 family protein [Bacteroidota bacterium]